MSKTAFDRVDAMVFFGGITALTAISIDIILPATGIVAREFGLPEQMGAMLVGSYFIAYAIGQMFWGLFSDAFGRKRALILSLIGFTITSFACAFAPNFTVLVVMRALQGLTGGTPVIARAMVRDETSGTEAAKILTVLSAILTVATLIAPVLGSGLLVLFDWRAIFVALGLLGLAFLAYAIMAVEETSGERRPERFSIGFVAQSSRFLLKKSAFVVPMIMGGLSFGGYAAILSVGAVLVENSYAVSPEAFGSLFALAALSNTAGALWVRHLLKSHPLPRMVRLAVLMLGLAAIFSFLSALATPDLPMFWGVVCFYVLGFGMLYPTAVAMAMEPAGEMPGFAASLMGATQMGMGALGAVLATSIYDGSHRAIPITMCVFGIAAVMVMVAGRRATAS